MYPNISYDFFMFFFSGFKEEIKAVFLGVV